MARKYEKAFFKKRWLTTIYVDGDIESAISGLESAKEKESRTQ